MCDAFQLSREQLHTFQYAIRHHYWYDMFIGRLGILVAFFLFIYTFVYFCIDGLPVWGYVGQVTTEADHREEIQLFQHREFILGYNADRIVQVDLQSYNPVALIDPARAKSRHLDFPTVHFTYSVLWNTSTRTFRDRFERYLDTGFFQHRVHWFSVANSFVLVLLLASVVFGIMVRILRRDIARYDKGRDVLLGDLEPDFMADEWGWKLLHGDVFRPPVHRIYLAALVGVGRQLFTTCLALILLTILTDLYEEYAIDYTLFS